MDRNAATAHATMNAARHSTARARRWRHGPLAGMLIAACLASQARAQDNTVSLGAADVLHPFVYFCLETDGDRVAIDARAGQQGFVHARAADTGPEAPRHWPLRDGLTLTSFADGGCAITVAQPLGPDIIEGVRRAPHAWHDHFKVTGDTAEGRFAVFAGDGDGDDNVRVFNVTYDVIKAEVRLLDRAALRRERELGHTATLAPQIIEKREFGPRQALARFQTYCVDTLDDPFRADQLAVIDGGYTDPNYDTSGKGDVRIWFFPNLVALVLFKDECSVSFDNEHKPLREYDFGERARSSLIRRINSTVDHAEYHYGLTVEGDDGIARAASVRIEASTDRSQFRLTSEPDAVETTAGESVAAKPQ